MILTKIMILYHSPPQKMGSKLAQIRPLKKWTIMTKKPPLSDVESKVHILNFPILSPKMQEYKIFNANLI